MRGGLVAAVLLATYGGLQGQTGAVPPGTPTLRTTSTLVLVPTLVRTRAGEPVFNLKASDFRLTDNGVPQQVTVDGVERQPLHVVVLLQRGGAAQRHFADFARLGTVVNAMLGQAAGDVMLVTFDSRPEEVWTFPPQREGLDAAFAYPEPGDGGAAILDAVAYALDLLDRPTQGEIRASGRRLILLISQPQDDGSKASAEQVVKRIGESNTTVYSATFSPESSWLKDQLRPFTQTDGYAPGHGEKVTVDLLTPLLMAVRAMRKDTPGELAMLSGGEHLRFSQRRDLEDKLMQMANELPNSYLLSFAPATPQIGLHTLRVEVPRQGVVVTARGSYYAEAPEMSRAGPGSAEAKPVPTETKPTMR